MRYYIIAGEKSGDIYGGRLIQALQQVDNQAVCRGWGGNRMQQAGAELVMHYKEIAVMGIGFIYKLKQLYNSLTYCKKDIYQFKPDAVIFIDYAGFNLRIAKFAKKQRIKTFYYISPKLWAWNAKRIDKVKAYIDKIFSIFPFEKDFYRKHSYYAVEYVGNPLLEQKTLYYKNTHFLSLNQLDSRPIIALLPGSRIQEVERLLPVMLTLVASLPTYQFVVAAISELPAALYVSANHTPGVHVIYDQIQDILTYASAAVVTSGTATLEVAYFDIPQVVVYKTDCLTYIIAKWLVKLSYISLINILAKEEVVKELIQKELTFNSLYAAVNEIVTNTSFKQKQLASYKSIRNLLGEREASIHTAQAIYKDLIASR